MIPDSQVYIPTRRSLVTLGTHKIKENYQMEWEQGFKAGFFTGMVTLFIVICVIPHLRWVP